jgi:elongation factor P
MIKATEIRRGIAIIIDGTVYIVHEFQHVAKGNWRSYIQAKLRNLKTGQLIEQRIRSTDTIEESFVDKKEMEYLYSQGTEHIFMDLETYEQAALNNDLIGDMMQWLKPNTTVMVTISEGQMVGIEPPNTVDLRVTETPPVVKGATATNQSKEAILETGAKVRVPPFIETGEMIRVDTRTGEYVERVKESTK